MSQHKPTGRSPQKTAAQAILELLARERRRVLSDWRAAILLRRATATTSPLERRWSKAPARIPDTHRVLRQMLVRGHIRPLDNLRDLYEVIVPYASLGPISEDETIMEVNPYAALSHLSALVFHGLSNQLPKTIIAIAPKTGTGGILPVGTEPEEWYGVAKPPRRFPSSVLGRPVRWRRVSPNRFFGTREYRPRGYPVRVTTPEYTLLDGLLEPELCGGLDNVLRAWALAIDMLDLDILVAYVDYLDIDLLRQRVGFVLDELGLSHPEVEKWRTKANRGGSSKLLSSAPFAPTYSERWNLSINFPVSSLHEGGA